MNPKQKAKELVESFENASSNKISDYSIIYTPTAKVCALMCLDEILKLRLIINKFEPNYANQEDYFEYWEEVKQEINKQ